MRKKKHGGRRPGAGAPVGNTNALKSGAFSPRVLRIFVMAMRPPEERTAAVEHWKQTNPQEAAILARRVVALTRQRRLHPVIQRLLDAYTRAVDRGDPDVYCPPGYVPRHRR